MSWKSLQSQVFAELSNMLLKVYAKMMESNLPKPRGNPGACGALSLTGKMWSNLSTHVWAKESSRIAKKASKTYLCMLGYSAAFLLSSWAS
jgi:hypothetical protein